MATNIAAIIAQINPLMGAAIAVITTIRSLRDAARAANPTTVTDKSTGAVYMSTADARAAGVSPENIVLGLPDDATLIANLLRDSGLLKTEAAELKAWLQEQINAEG